MKESLKSIIVPVNSSENFNNALKTGIAMCKRHRAVLHLLYVKEARNLVFPPGKNPQLLQMMLEAEMAILDKLEEQANDIMAQNKIVCFYHTAEGPYYQTIASKARDLYADLIIIEKNPSNNGFNLFKTNKTYQLLKHTSCAILTVPREEIYLDFKNILFPVRALPNVLEKLRTILPIIRKNSSRVLLLSALATGTKDEHQQSVNNLIREADQLMSKENLPVETELNQAEDVAKEVVKKAIEKKSDLIVISATLTSGIKALFTRDYTQKVIEDSPVPVLCVKLAY